jgi:hypothetical protein
MNRTVVYSFLASALLLLIAQDSAHAQLKPFKVRGAGVGTLGLPLPGQDPRPHWIVGQATHLGRHYGEGAVRTDTAEFDPESGKITGEFGSGAPFVFIGANGDELVCHYGRTDFGASQPGTFELTIVGVLDDGSLVVEALWIAEFVPLSDECTGKFAGITGSWIMFASSEPFVLGSNDPVHYQWEGEGALRFAQGD